MSHATQVISTICAIEVLLSNGMEGKQHYIYVVIVSILGYLPRKRLKNDPIGFPVVLRTRNCNQGS